MLQKAWFSQKKWIWVLFPFTLVFYLLSACRRQLYQLGLKAATGSSLPVIIVGNISVGGNGKTPLTLALAKQLQGLGYTPAILSRGYGGSQTHFPWAVTSQCSASLVGDEPALIARRLKCDVVIDPQRVRGCEFITQHTQANVIICDDGLQHYALKRDIELCVLDKRGLGNGYLLPMGPLREGKWRLNTIDACIFNVGDKVTGTELLLQKDNTPFFNMSLTPSAWVNVKTGQVIALSQFSTTSKYTVALAGIGDPQRFFDTLENMQIMVNECIGLVDHHRFKQSDLRDDARILMTEKDAVKCTHIAHEDCWYLQINAVLPEPFYALINHKLVASGKVQ